VVTLTPSSPEFAPARQTPVRSDVVVVGGGIAGKAASLHLSKAGLKVACIDAPQSGREAVGESLDWSSPDLLNALGLGMEQIVSERIGTWKRHVVLKMPCGSPEDYVPVPWLAGTPFHVELRTLHVDRSRLDKELHQKVAESGTTLVSERAVRVQRDAERVVSVRTESGQEFAAPWFIDASGFATSLFAREFNIRADHSGPRKVAMWTYFPLSDPIEGTTLYMEPAPTSYLDWIWEIPIQTGEVSVGYVSTADAIKEKRQQGTSVEAILEEALLKFPRFSQLLEANKQPRVNVTSFQSRTHAQVAGPNWLIAGEAAALVDPITSNGVTAALRHAAEASRLIVESRSRNTLPRVGRFCYGLRVRQVAKFFNDGIENVVYQTPVRNRIGIRHAGTLYISPAWTLNLFYARLKPKGIASTFLLLSIFGFVRFAERLLFQLCKLFS
jgi:menaquinone-9 beta-reductase